MELLRSHSLVRFCSRARFVRSRLSRQRLSRLRFREMLLETLEVRHLLAADWQNRLFPEDVTGSDVRPVVSPLDALLVINELNSGAVTGGSQGRLPAPNESLAPPAFYDVSGDGFATPIDALLIINYLNTRSLQQRVEPEEPLVRLSVERGGTTAPAPSNTANAISTANELLINTTRSNVQQLPAIATNNAGAVVVWASLAQDGSEWGVYGQRLDAAGAKVGSEFRVSQTTQLAQQRPSVDVWPDGRFVVAWESFQQTGDENWGVYARLFNADGIPAGDEFHVNQSVTAAQRSPSVAVLTSGSFVIAWEGRGVVDSSRQEDYEIFVRQFSAQGNALTSEQRVNTPTLGFQERASVAASPNGGFVIAWNGTGVVDSAGVYLRRFDSAASPVATEVLVNGTFTQGIQSQPALDISSDGRILVAWASTEHQSGWGIYAQQFATDGTLIGQEVRINQPTIATQWNPSVAYRPDNSFVVSWEGCGPQEDYGVYVRQFNASGLALAGEERINPTTTGMQRDARLVFGPFGMVATWDGQGDGDFDGVFVKEIAPVSPSLIDGSPFTLREGSNFKVQVERGFVVPSVPSILEVAFGTPAFDNQSTSSPLDAFEISVVDVNGRTLVLPISNTRDATFNLSEGKTAIVGANSKLSTGKLQIDLTNIPAGTSATLIARLVNDDADIGTSVTVNSLQIVAGSLGTPIGIQSVSSTKPGPITDSQLNGLQEVTSDFGFIYGTTSFNERDDFLFTELALRNSGAEPALGPLVAVIDNISDPTVALRDFDGATRDGRPYINFTSSVVGGALKPGETTSGRVLSFINPQGVQFSFTVRVFRLSNTVPALRSIPTQEALVGQLLSFTPVFDDPDDQDGVFSDVNQFALVTSPSNMQIDAQNGRISWTPTLNDLGTHQVTIRVADNFGKQAEQTFTIVVRQNVPNRPPIITSSPVTDAAVSLSFEVQDIAVGRSPVGVAVGNFNGLGNSVLTANQINQSVSLAEFLSNQNYAAAVNTQLGEPPQRTDQLFEQGYNLDVGFLLNRSQSVQGFTSADFNGDGIPDIAVTTYSSGHSRVDNALVLLIGIGDGTFAPPRTIYHQELQQDTNRLFGVLARDFDGDNVLDLVVAEVGNNSNGRNLIFFKGNGNAMFASPVRSANFAYSPHYIRASDFNGDDKLDIAMAGARDGAWQVEVTLGNGNGTFAAPVAYNSTPGRYIPDIQLADVDGKNGDDLVIADWSFNRVEVRLNDGKGVFGEPLFRTSNQGGAAAVYADDFNRDGKIDLHVGHVFNTVTTFLGNGDGTFLQPPDSSPLVQNLGFQPNRAYADAHNSATDLNGDGRLDVYFASRFNNVIAIGFGRGDGSFDYQFMFAQPASDDPTRPPEGSGFSSPLAIDTNRDGVLDMATASFSNSGRPGKLSVILGDALGSFRTPKIITSPNIGAVQANTLADVDNDGAPDILQIGPPIATALNNADGTFAPAQRAVGNFSGPGEFFGNQVVMADFDGDGNQDAFFHGTNGVQGGPPARLILSRGLGNGAYELPTIFGTGAFAIGTADINGDNKPDPIAIIGGVGKRIEIWINNGSATGFTRVPDSTNRLSYPVTGGAFSFQHSSFVIADMDGDAIADLVAHSTAGENNTPPEQFMFFKGRASSNPTDVSDLFDAPLITTPGFRPIRRMATADLNHDGKLDVLALRDIGGFYVMLGNGDGTFATPVFYGHGFEDLSVADFDGDGHLDVGLTNSFYAPTFLRGKGDGTLGRAEYYASFQLTSNYNSSAADVDGDRAADFLFGSGNDAGAYRANTVLISRRPGVQAVTTGDLNGDGKLDALAVDYGLGHLTPLFGDGQGSLTRQLDLIVDRGPVDAVIADVSGDNIQDIISVNRAANTISVLIAGTGGQYMRTDLDTGRRPVSVAVKEVTGDNLPDILVANSDENSVSIFKNLGSGKFDIETKLAIGIRPSHIAVGDTDGDSKNDIIVGSEGNRGIVVAINQGAGVFTPLPAMTVAESLGGLALGDVTRDGRADLIVANPDERRVSLFIGLGAGKFAKPQSIDIQHSPIDITLADMDGDRQLDIVTANGDSDTATVIVSRFDPDSVYKYKVTAADPDGDAATFSLTNSPAGMSIDAATGQITWAAMPNQIGDHPVTITASDGRGGSATQAYTVTVTTQRNNTNPTFVTQPLANGLPTTNYQYAARAADAEKDPLRYEIMSGPDGLVIDHNTGDIAWGETIGRGVRFNGKDDMVVVGSTPSLQFTDELSFSTWVKFDQTPIEAGHNAYLVGSRTEFRTTALYAREFGGTDRFIFDYQGRFAVSNSIIHPNVWYHVAATYTFDKTIRLYVNGVLESESTVTGFSRPNETFLTIGNDSAEGDRESGLDGWLDSVRVFNRALTARQISDETRRIGPNPASLVGDWQFNELDGPLAYDSSGNKNDGTLAAPYAGRRMRATLADRVTPGGRSGDYPITLRATDGRGGIGEQSFTLHIAADEPSGLAGKVFNDQNADNQSSGDPGLSNWIVYLDLDKNGTRESYEPTSTTDANGYYAFKNLTSGSYQISISGQPGYRSTVPAIGSTTVNLPAGQNPFIDQYASSVIAFSSQAGGDGYSALRAIGAPNATFGYNENAWSPGPDNTPNEFITLGYATPLNAYGVTITESSGNGFVSQVDLLDTNDVFHTVFTGVDPTPTNRTANFRVSFPLTDYLVKGVKVYVDGTRNGSTKDQIDAVQLNGIDTTKNVNFGQTTLGVAASRRAPAFTSSPVVAGQVGVSYHYQTQVRNLDGPPLAFDVLVAPAGLGINAETGGIAWLPTVNQSGNHRVLIRVKDDRGLVDIQDFTITVSAAPTAPVIASQPGLNALVGLPYRYAARAQDAEGGQLTFSLTSPPTGMTVNSQNGVVTWTPTAQQTGANRVSLVVTDSTGLTGTQVFDITVAVPTTNNAPHITSSPRTSVGLDRPYRYQVLANDSSGDPIAYSLTTKPTGMTIDDAGMLRWEPDQLGDIPVTVQVTDGRGGSESQNFTLQVVSQLTNSSPRFTSASISAVAADLLFAYDPTIADPDGDPVRFLLDEGPAGLSLDPATGSLRWQTTETTRGDFPVTIRALDPYNAETTQSFTLAVRSPNAPPAITSTPPTEAVASVAYNYAVAASDPFGRALNYSLLKSPAGMTINATTGIITWTPTSTQLGVQSVSLQVTNSAGGAAMQAYDVVVTSGARNLPPVISSTAPSGATVGVIYQYDIQATDPEGLPLRYELRSGPATMSVDPATGRVTWTPTAADLGTIRVTVAALDPANAAAVQSFLLTVLAVNRTPTITSAVPTKPLSGGATFRHTIVASDLDFDPLGYTLTTAPAGMAIDGFGRITWPTTAANIGQHPVDVTVSDGRGGSATQSFTLNVVADTTKPKVSVIPANNLVYFKNPAVIRVAASDDVGIASISLSMDGQPIALDSQGTAVIPFPADGRTRNSTFTATAIDPAGNSQTASNGVKFFNSADITVAPQVGIISPVDAGVVFGPTDVIGTVTDDNLRQWKLLVKPEESDDGAFTELATGTTTITNAKLGRFDPTLLENGSYVLRLIASDDSGNEVFTDNRIGVSGELKLGNFQLSFTDLTIPVSGIPITITRTYDTLRANREGDFGFGWRLDFRNTDLRTGLPKTGLEDFGIYSAFRPGTKVYLTLPGGKREGFTFTPDIRALPGFGSTLTTVTPRFTPDPGVTNRLSVKGGTFILGDDGAIYSGGGQPYNPAAEEFGGGYTLSTKEGTVFRIDGNTGKLERVTDRNQNQLTFSDTGITGSGINVQFERDAGGRIVSITDPTGAKLRYAYSPTGDLTKITDRVGYVTQITYRTLPAHYLETIVDPLGRTGARTDYDANGRLIRLTNAQGKTITTTYNPDNSLVSSTDVLGNSTTLEYDTRGNIVSKIDPLGGLSRATYDANNNALSITDALNHTTSFTYDTAGNKLTKTDPLGNTSRYTYDGFAHQTSFTDPLGNTISGTYDRFGNLLTRTEADGTTSLVSNDGHGRFEKVTNVVGFVSSFAYDSFGRLTELINSQRNGTTYTYDSTGNQLTKSFRVTTPDGTRTVTTVNTYDANGRVLTSTAPDGGVTIADYDAAGNLTSLTDPLGRRTQYTYDTLNRRIKTLYADASFEESTFDDAGREVAVKDRSGRITAYTYDALGRRTQTTNPDNSTTKIEYDAVGNVTKQTDERNNSTEYTYDAANRQISSKNALGKVELTAYDALGRRISVTNPLQQSMQFTYDAMGRQTAVTFADGTKATTAYDLLGRAVAQTDQTGATTKFEYDSLDQLTSVTDPLGHRTTYTYDEIGNRIAQTDANGRTTRFEYDAVGRQTAITLPLGQRSSRQYDFVGNVTQTKDFHGQTTTYTYNSNNLPANVVFPDARSLRFTYTASLQRSTVSQIDGLATSTTSYVYDNRDRLTSVTSPDGQTIQYTYDTFGNQTSVTTSGVGTTQYTFDSVNRLQTVRDSSNNITQYQYDDAGNLTRKTLPNAVIENRTYDSLNRLLSTVSTGPNGAIFSQSLMLRADGRISAIEEQGPSGRINRSFEYDASGRLTAETIAGLTPTPRTIHWTHDAVGNRITQFDSVKGITTHQYDANDRLTKTSHDGTETTITYDANGNQLTSFTSANRQTTYVWNSENRLISATVTEPSGATNTHYRYDADGNLIARTTSGQETRLLVDVNGDLSQVFKEYTPDGATITSYVRGIDLISQTRTGTTSYYLLDATGSTRVLVGPTGATLNTYLYDASGNVLALTEPIPNSYQYQGAFADASTDLTYLRARWLDASSSRFVSQDPFAGNIQLPISFNDYLYAHADPLNLHDPTGKSPLTEVLTRVAVYSFLAAGTAFILTGGADYYYTGDFDLSLNEANAAFFDVGTSSLIVSLGVEAAIAGFAASGVGTVVAGAFSTAGTYVVNAGRGVAGWAFKKLAETVLREEGPAIVQVALGTARARAAQLLEQAGARGISEVTLKNQVAAAAISGIRNYITNFRGPFQNIAKGYCNFLLRKQIDLLRLGLRSARGSASLEIDGVLFSRQNFQKLIEGLEQAAKFIDNL